MDLRTLALIEIGFATLAYMLGNDPTLYIGSGIIFALLSKE